MKSEQQSNAPWDSPGRVARKRKRLQSCYYGDCAVKPHNKEITGEGRRAGGWGLQERKALELSQVTPQHSVRLPQQFTGTRLYYRVERGTVMKVKCLARCLRTQHNDSESSFLFFVFIKKTRFLEISLFTFFIFNSHYLFYLTSCQ